MKNKRTKFLLFLLAAMLIFTLVFAVACTQRTTEEDEDNSGGGGGTTRPAMTFEQYMSKINAGLKASETRMGEMTDYYVASEYTLYTRVENLTVTYEAVYKENRRDGNYYIRVFDNGNHIERLNVYYNGTNLYVTVRDIHYVVRDFSSLMLFDTFSAFLDLVDIEEYAYGTTMQTYLSPTSPLSIVIGVNDFTYAKAGESGESITLKGNFDPIMGVVNAMLVGLTEKYGTVFDSVTDHYLGFSFSHLVNMALGSLLVEEMRFNLDSGVLTHTTLNIGGRMQDNTPYKVSGAYSYDETTQVIASASGIPTRYEYQPVTPGTGAYEGEATVFDKDDTTIHQFSADYDINAKNNAENRFTVRTYDQLSTRDEYTAETKYNNINELVSAYYNHEILYVNTEGLYNFFGSAISLSALRLPKIYFTGFNLTSVMSLAYSDILQILNTMLKPSEADDGGSRSRAVSAVINAMESDVEKKEIKITVTEELVRDIRGDNTGLAEIFADMLGVDVEVFNTYLGPDFFERFSIVLRYNFGTHHLFIEIYDLSEEVAALDIYQAENVGVIFPNDLNDLTYAEFAMPEMVTLTFAMEFSPYGSPRVDVSGFFGSFIGDATGKNTPYALTIGQTIVVEGRMSEYYQFNYAGERENVTTMDMRIYRTSEAGSQRELWMSVATNPASRTASELLIRSCLPMGSYDGEDDIYYVIDRKVVTEELNKLTEGTSVLSQGTGLSTFLALYGAASRSSKAYTQDGYFCVDLMITDEKDPIKEMIGVEGLTGRVKCKIGFDALDLSGIDADLYTIPYVHEVDDVSKNSIYSKGSAWKEKMTVTVGGKRIDFLTTYDPKTIEIVTGKTSYSPTAYMFGKEFSYAFNIVTITGTYKVRSVDIDNDLIIIDPAYTGIPESVPVTFEGAESGMLECEIEGFKESWVTNDGYNLPLLAGEFGDMPTYKLVIGRDSIATIEKDVYITVICRKIISVVGEDGNDEKYVKDGKQIPVVAKFVADPYTYAMEKKMATDAGQPYDYLTRQLEETRTTIQFESLYGTTTEKDDAGEDVVVELYYNEEGYNWFYLSELDLAWQFPETEFSWRGETRYATATFGAEGGRPVEIAIRVDVSKKEVQSVRIDSFTEGTYTVDYLKKETYEIPTVTADGHTVVVVFKDGTTRTVVRGKPSATISDEAYCSEYVYGQLVWEGADGVAGKLEEQGTMNLFGTGAQANNETTAAFGGDLLSATQTVHLSVVAPSRYISGRDNVSVYLVPSISEDGTLASPTSIQVTKTARFTRTTGEPTGDVESFAYNPYDTTVTLPSTIWLYVNVTMSDSGAKEWIEYPVEWVTTNKSTVDDNGNEIPGDELNIIKLNATGDYYPINRTNDETRRVVYGRVGVHDSEYDRRIWVTMSLLNMESNIRDYTLYLPDGTMFNKEINADGKLVARSAAISVDPYLSYVKNTPSHFEAVLGSGETIPMTETEWYCDEYPLYRLDKDGQPKPEVASAAFDTRYDENGYYVFPKQGGTFTLWMNVSAGEENSVSNYIYAEVTVNARSLQSDYTDESQETKVSDYVDLFRRQKTTEDGRAVYYTDGETYTGRVTAGYTEINYYAEDSATLLARIEELIGNDGVGTAGVSFAQTAERGILYAKTVVWDLDVLLSIRDALQKKSNKLTFEGAGALTGVMDANNINRTTVTVRLTISERTRKLNAVTLTNARSMTEQGVYAVTNDVDGNGTITIGGASDEYSSMITNVNFYRNDRYNTYFGTTGYYQDAGYDGFLYFAVEETFRLSATGNGFYVAPYDYFTYLFGNLRLEFASLYMDGAKADVSTGTRDETFFNNSVLGFNEDTIVTEASGKKKSYSFLILEHFSKGSAVERTLVIVEATVAKVRTLTRDDRVDALQSDLTEMYNENNPFELPVYVEVEFRKEGTEGEYYVARYAVDEWESLSFTFGDKTRITQIENRYINIIEGVKYDFKFTLPDMETQSSENKEFMYSVRFNPKNIDGKNYNAAATNSLYNITNGTIYVDNSYTFLTPLADGRYSFDLDQVPKTLVMVNETGRYQSTGTDVFAITRWTFDERNTKFDESIFRTGTVDTDGSNDGIVIARYVFNSYYADGEQAKQTVELRLSLPAMNFSRLEASSDNVPLDVVLDSTDTGENPTYNTIVIDPYVRTSGNLRLPTVVTVVFNGTQEFTTSDVSFSLVNELTGSAAPTTITNVMYDEKGHLINESYTLDPSLLKLEMFVRGYTGKGIRINIKFLQRTISDLKLPNYVYDEEGAQKYEEKNGSVVFENGEPVRKEYYAYAEYAFTASNSQTVSESGFMPVYYIDPYNTATFALPTMASFEFEETSPGEYLQYKISGWQYYDDRLQTYANMPPEETAGTPFYRENDTANNLYRCYFLPDENSYKGAFYALRGYVQVGEKAQYFDVVCVVLNRSLKASVVLEQEYTVSYDFSDPVAALLTDIPSILGAETFVGFDAYNREFLAESRREKGVGTFLFRIEEGDMFSQKREGVATNFPVVPHILWRDTYDLDGDGVEETAFAQLTDVGFDGVIDGNLYFSDNRLKLLFDFYERKAEADYTLLTRARAWDSFFNNGTVSVAYSDTAQNAIREEEKKLDDEVIYDTYFLLLDRDSDEDDVAAFRALSAANKQTLRNALYVSAVNDYKIKYNVANFDEEDEEAVTEVVKAVYEKVMASRKAWNGEEENRNSQVEIGLVWENALAEYKGHDAVTSRNVSEYQKRKAQHFLNVYSSGGNLSPDEVTRVEYFLSSTYASLYVNINVDVWNDVYEVANASERRLMSDYAEQYRTADEKSGVSIASDAIRNHLEEENDVGAKGERAVAEATMPHIDFRSLAIDGEQTVTVEFNKFNFASVTKTFSVTFDVDYTAVYARMEEEARARAIKQDSDDKKANVLTEYETRAIKDAVNAAVPKTYNQDGEAETIEGLRTNANLPATGFNYDRWVDGSQQGYYSAFWANLLQYRYDEAVKFIYNNIENVNVKSYDDVLGLSNVSVEEWNAISYVFINVKAEEMALAYAAYLEEKYDYTTADGRKKATEDLISYVLLNDEGVTSRYGAFLVLGIRGTGSDDYVVDPEGWTEIKRNFVTEMAEIASQIVTRYETQYRVSLSTTNRANAVKALAVYVVEEDKAIEDLEQLYDAAELEKRIEFARLLLAFGVSDRNLVNALSNIGKEYQATLSGSTAGNPDVGNAIILMDAYADVLDLVYDIIMEPSLDGKPLGYSADTKIGLETVLERYTVNKYSFDATGKPYKAIVLYIALNGGETSNMGDIRLSSDIRNFSQFVLELLTSYVVAERSPYDMLLEDPSATNFTTEQIESYVGGELSPDCLLYYTTPNESYVNLLLTFANRLNLTEEQIVLAVKRYTLYNAIYNSLTTSAARDELNALATKAKRDRYATAAKAIIDSASETTKTHLNNFIHAGTTSLEATAFTSLFAREEQKGREKGEVYKKYRDEYVEKNEYAYSADLILALWEEYKTSLERINATNLVDKGYIAYHVYAEHFQATELPASDGRTEYLGTDGFIASVTEAGTTKRYFFPVSYRDERMEEEAAALLRKYRLDEAFAKTVADRYLEDAFLNVVVYFYENVATEDQKKIVEEVSETYTGVSVEEGDVGRMYTEAAMQGLLNARTDSSERVICETGKSIYEDLLTRDDMGLDVGAKLTACYYTVWLRNMIRDTEFIVRTYPAEEVTTTAPYNNNNMYRVAENTFKAATGLNTLTDAMLTHASDMTAETVRRNMLSVMTNSIAYEDAYQTVVMDNISEFALKYAYDCVYNGEGGAFVDVFDKILAELVGQGTAVDRLTFLEMQQAVLDGKLAVLQNATKEGVRVSLYNEIYDEITLLNMTADEFAGYAYEFLKGMEAENPALLLFGPEKDGKGGIIGGVLTVYADTAGNVPPASEADRLIELLTEWWNLGDSAEEKTMYGRLGSVERAFIEQIHSQAKYQVSALLADSSFDNETREEIAYATMLTSIYLFLTDLEEYVKENVPKDYLTEGNEKEYKAFVIRSLLESDVMKRDGHSLTLAQATLSSLLYERAETRAKAFYSICYGSDLAQTYGETEEYLSLIADSIISTTTLNAAATEAETNARNLIYYTYITKAVEYVGYTSVAGSEDYELSEDYLTTNPLRAYADAVSLKITGYNKSGTGALNVLSSYQFGMQTFGEIYSQHNNYTAALNALLTGSREVTAEYVGEDHADAKEKHVVYFDRHEWDEALANGTLADANYYNKNLFFSNAQKTEKTTDVSGGYGYTSSIRTTGFRYTFSDFVDVDLYFYGTSNPANALAIDALAPELPSVAFARGLVGKDDVDNPKVDLGEVEITEYSDEFRKLVYSGTVAASTDNGSVTTIRTENGDDVVCVKDPAYYVVIKAANGDTFRVSNLFVGYLDRQVREVFLYPVQRDSKEEYTYGKGMRGDTITDPDSEYVDMYSTLEDSRDTNVLYVDPTNEDLLLSTQRTYVLPSTIAVRSGQGGRVTFTDVEWDLSEVPYGLAGTGSEGVKVKILSYGYEDSDGYKRIIRYNYALGTADMYVYEDGNVEDESVEPVTYLISEDIDWNVRLVVEDKSLNSISVPAGDTFALIGLTTGNYVDATGSMEINPYYPELPLTMRLNLGDSVADVTLASQSDWIPNVTLLRNIINGESNDNEFTATFGYLGYAITVRFKAMDIHVMTASDIERTEGAIPYDGGTVYFVRGAGDAKTQFEKNYALAYFNFGDEISPNWQKVPVALHNYSSIDMGTGNVQEADGIIGGFDDANAKFRVRVVTFSTYATLNDENNYYVGYDYYSLPADNNEFVNIVAGDRDGMTGKYYVTGETSPTFTVSEEDGKTERDFVNREVRVTLRYEYDENVSSLLAFNEHGDRVREYMISMEMKPYERSDISDLRFDLTATDKIWTKANVLGNDSAIYWPLGRSMTTSDLPVLVDKETHVTVYPMWDLTNFNVNRANVSVKGEIRDGDGTTITGWYLTRNNTWEAARLTVYIEKTDVRAAFINAVVGSEYDLKSYDAQYYDLFAGMPEGQTILSLLREDGTYESFTKEDFIVTYYLYDETTRELTALADGALPMNAGSYRINVELKERDYNAFISEGEGWLYTLTVSPCLVSMPGITFEDENSGRIARTYGETTKYLVVESGLPAFAPANWFTEGEKKAMYDEFRDRGMSDERAKAEVYSTINRRVTAYVSENLIMKWYDEGEKVLSSDPTFAAIEDSDEKAIKIMAWVYDNRMTEEAPLVQEVGVVITYALNGEILPADFEPRDVGSYSVSITLEANDNYAATGEKNLMLVVEKNQNVSYSVQNASLVYSGGAQNLIVSGLHINGAVPVGVTVTYSYVIPDDDGGENKTLVVIVRGTTDSDGNSINVTSIDLDATTLSPATSGIKDVGTYVCSIDIDGGRNYINGSIENVGVTISRAEIYVELEDVTAIYLDAVANINDRIRIYNKEGVEQEAGVLLGSDRIGDLGVIVTRTPVRSHFRTGTYYMYIDGLKLSDAETYLYTDKTGSVTWQGETYAELTLKSFEMNGSLYKDTDNNASVINTFNNYRIFVKTHFYSNVDQTEGAAGRYRIALKEDLGDADTVASVSSDEELAAVINGLRDGSNVAVYLAPLTDENGVPKAYAPISVNGRSDGTTINATITLIGDTWSGGTVYIGAINQYAGTLRLLDLVVRSTDTRKVGVTLFGDAERLETDGCLFEEEGGAVNTVGIRTEEGFGGKMFLQNTSFTVDTPFVTEAGSGKETGEIETEVSGKEDLAAYIGSLRDGNRIKIYLSPLYTGGELDAYDAITINVAADVTIVGYRSNETNEIESIIRGVNVLKGTFRMSIVAIKPNKAGATGLFVGDDVNYVEIEDCLFSKEGTQTNVTGIQTSLNFKERLFLHDARFEGLSMAIYFVGGELEIETSTFYKNYNAITITAGGRSISIKASTFSNNTDAGIRSVTGSMTVRENRFEYNGIALDLPAGSSIKENVNNGNAYIYNGDD